MMDFCSNCLLPLLAGEERYVAGDKQMHLIHGDCIRALRAELDIAQLRLEALEPIVRLLRDAQYVYANHSTVCRASVGSCSCGYSQWYEKVSSALTLPDRMLT